MKKTLLLALFTLVLCVSSLLIPAPASAQFTKKWTGVCVANEDVATIQGFQCLVANLLQIAVTGIAFAGFVMLIFGAFGYLASGGNSKGVDESRKTITYAILGLILALSAFFILRFISDFTGVKSILNFTIPSSETKTDEL